MQTPEKVVVLAAWLLSLAGGCLPAAALDPAKAFHHYRLDVWQPEDGLPWNSVTVVLQTSDGYLWLGSYEGLARFDGVRFTVFDRTNTPELRDNVVYALAEAADGSLWIGTDGGGATRLADGRFTAYTAGEGLADDRVTDISTGRDGGLWIATRGGLTRVRDGRFTSIGRREGLPEELVWTAEEDRDGVLWIGTDEGLARLADGVFSRVALGEECRPDCGVSVIAEDDGGLWIGTFGGGLFRFEDGVPVSFRHLGHDLLTIRRDRAGSLWIATNGGGLLRLRGGELASYDMGEGLVSDTVWSFVEDREGSLWLGTEGGGLHRLRDTRIVSYTTRDGLPHDRAWVIYEDREGRLWLGTDGGGLASWEAGEIRTYTSRDGLTSDVVTALHQGRDGTLWIGTLRGLSRLRGGEIAPAFTAETGADAVVAAVHEDPRGTLWVGTDRGLLRLDGGATTAYGMAEGLPAAGVTALAGGPRGALWIGTDGGLVTWRDGKLAVPPGAGGLAGAFVRAIHVDAEDTVWVGTRGDGLVRWRDGEAVTYTARDGLHSEVIYQILEDGSGNLWLSCNRGIFRVAKRELDEVARGVRPAVRSTAYGAADGMTSLECLGDYQPAGWRTRDGRLWFPTTRGVAAIDPANLALNELPPPVHIERVLADGAPVDSLAPGATATLPPGRGELEFHYTALSLVDPAGVRFRYRLAGYDDGWVEAGTRRSAYYTNLAPGSYRFQVIASNNDGVWNEVGDARRLTLRPAFHQTWLFYAACALALALGGRGLHRLRVRALRRHNEDLRRVQRLLEAKNAEVEAKSTEMERFTYAVSHDLKSPLFTIQGFLGYLERDLGSGDLEQAERDIRRLRGTAAKMQELLEELLELSRIGRIAGEPQEVDLGELAREAAELVAGRIAERGVEVVISPRLPTVVGDRRRLLQVMQNLIDNAVKYIGAASEPRVEIGVVDDAARPASGEAAFYVRDNGAGIDPRHHRRIFDLFRQLDPGAEGTGIGLVLVKKILEVHGGKIWVESEGEGKGSTFYFTIPRRPAG